MISAILYLFETRWTLFVNFLFSVGFSFEFKLHKDEIKTLPSKLTPRSRTRPVTASRARSTSIQNSSKTTPKTSRSGITRSFSVGNQEHFLFPSYYFRLPKRGLFEKSFIERVKVAKRDSRPVDNW